MTGGQYSPTSPLASLTTTSPKGVPEPPFDICVLAIASGANFVARTTAYHVTQLKKLLKQALMKKGFSVLEVLSPCPTHFGRRNLKGGPLEMMKYLKEKAVPQNRYEKMDPDERSQNFSTGVFIDRERPDFLTVYWELNKADRKAEQGGYSR